ncbi:hypothetical protein HMPREF0290_1553 [Corynebacterium efficiens YS-314]|uniref:Uncharacterized protein n=1 Tax=Corynebacterium efficiens (strain DSM 44549 / YS-314 / AJ 12310 / JCM 11189 / NBRC 100395) TaxID=196164 RepID=Q8FR60_COREF|nr:hypothetical protein HMPREF0290_1553 [Corynebacterium efficiens YS-314]BAC17714.1 hypothetical protein [Corynebacterium efficiens YS-314]
MFSTLRISPVVGFSTYGLHAERKNSQFFVAHITTFAKLCHAPLLGRMALTEIGRKSMAFHLQLI